MISELKKFKKLRKRILRHYSLKHDVPFFIANIIYMILVFISTGRFYAKAMRSNLGVFEMIKNILLAFIVFLPVWLLVAFIGWLLISPAKTKARFEAKEREDDLVKFKNKELDKLVSKNKITEKEKLLFLYRDTALTLSHKLSRQVDANLEDD